MYPQGYSSGAGAGMMPWNSEAYEARRRAMEEERLARVERMREEYAAIDAEEDPQKKLELRRARYACGERFVTLGTVEPLAALLPRLAVLPGNTTIDPAAAAAAPRGLWASANDTVTISESDVQRRFPMDDCLLQKVSVWRGNICAIEVDAIVNAANESLLGGGGIDGAIHSAAGPMLVEECRPLRGCETGNTKITRGYDLPAKHVLHTVGPMGRGDRQLRSCYRTCFELIEAHRLRTVAFCCVGTGIFGFPLVRATHIALSEARKWLNTVASRGSKAEAGHDAYTLEDIDCVVFVCFKDTELSTYERILPSYFPIDGLPTSEHPPTEEEEFNEDNARPTYSSMYKDGDEGDNYGAYSGGHFSV